MPVTTSTRALLYFAPHTAATQETKQTTAENLLSANARTLNLSSPLWIAVFVVAGVAAVVLVACIATIVHMSRRQSGESRVHVDETSREVEIELTETSKPTLGTEEEKTVVVSETETVVSETEAGVRATEAMVSETETTVRATETGVSETETTVRETETAVSGERGESYVEDTEDSL